MEITEEEKNNYFEKLRGFGSQFVAGFNTINEATQALDLTNETLEKNPRLLRFLSDPENILIFKEIYELVKDGISLKEIPKIAKLAKKLKSV